MKLHPDGTLEGTPEELAAFMRLKEQKPAATGGNWPPFVTDKTQSGATGIATGAKVSYASTLQSLDRQYDANAARGIK